MKNSLSIWRHSKPLQTLTRRNISARFLRRERLAERVRAGGPKRGRGNRRERREEFQRNFAEMSFHEMCIKLALSRIDFNYRHDHIKRDVIMMSQSMICVKRYIYAINLVRRGWGEAEQNERIEISNERRERTINGMP